MNKLFVKYFKMPKNEFNCFEVVMKKKKKHVIV